VQVAGWEGVMLIRVAALAVVAEMASATNTQTPVRITLLLTLTKLHCNAQHHNMVTVA
jgi:hypothetical protein